RPWGGGRRAGGRSRGWGASPGGESGPQMPWARRRPRAGGGPPAAAAAMTSPTPC
ncbi:unnamed protein product, partial [Prorocentrum cordatum]